MNKEKQNIKYILYARKSSESEDRQIQSIDAQVDRLKVFARIQNIKIVDVYTEAKSAKKPDNRPLYSKILERIEKGEIDGILCWHLNRLSRNPIDSGKLSWLLQEGVIKSIQTMEKEFKPEDNVLLFSVESGMANQFSRELSVNVKRGNQKKLEDGWRPGNAPTGYLNDLATHTLVIDPERFNLLRKAWDLMLTGNYTVPQVLHELNNNWGFRTLRKKRIGDKPLAMSGMYKVFTNLFYAGIIVHKGKHYPGKHDAMVTLAEYDHVQMILGRKGKARPKKHTFAFTGGVIRCGVCKCSFTAETKHKHIKSTGKVNEYTYYHCTKKKRSIKCTQNESVREEKLEAMIKDEIKKYTILPDFLQWALEDLNRRKNAKVEDEIKITEKKQKTKDQIQKEIKELTRMRYKGFINDETFNEEKNMLEESLNECTKENTQSKNELVLELTEKTFIFAAYALNKFLKGTPQDKREILSTLGQNQTINSGKLNIEAEKWLQPIGNNYPGIEKEYLRLELDKKPLNKVKSEQLSSLITLLHGV